MQALFQAPAARTIGGLMYLLSEKSAGRYREVSLTPFSLLHAAGQDPPYDLPALRGLPVAEQRAISRVLDSVLAAHQ